MKAREARNEFMGKLLGMAEAINKGLEGTGVRVLTDQLSVTSDGTLNLLVEIDNENLMNDGEQEIRSTDDAFNALMMEEFKTDE